MNKRPPKYINIRVRVEEMDNLDSAYAADPEILYEVTPVEPDLQGSMELICCRSQIDGLLRMLEVPDSVIESTSHTRSPIYAEPPKEAGELLNDAAHSVLRGFNNTAVDVVVEALKEMVMPGRMRRNRHN